MELTGAPKTVIGVSDQSLILSSPNSGIVCVQGPTLRGEPGKAVFVGNSVQYKRLFGGHHPSDLFATLVMRLLDSGAKVYVSRLCHYTNPADKTTIHGAKATATLSEVVATVTHSAVFNAKFVGAGYNGATVTVRAAESLKANHYDIVVSVPDSDISQTIKDVPALPTAAEVAALNNKLEHVQIGAITTGLRAGTVTLAGGVEDVSLITDTDYIGDNVAKTGWFAFGTVTDAFRIANINKPSPAVDQALAAYVGARKDMRFHIATPLGANAQGMEDYRMGSGAFVHAAIDSFYGTIVAGDVNVNDHKDTAVNYNIPGIVDVLALQARKDREFGPWISAAGGQRGKIIAPNNGIPYNLGAPDNQADFDQIYKKGINAVIKDDSFGPVYWGNKSLYLNQNSLLSKENVADLVVYTLRELKPLVRIEMFNPNDPTSWRTIYRNVRPFIVDVLEANRAIRPGENKKWFWIGDQNVTRAEDAVFNTQSDLDAGKYRARFVFVPITAIEFIGIDVTVTDSGSIELVVTESL